MGRLSGVRSEDTQRLSNKDQIRATAVIDAFGSQEVYRGTSLSEKPQGERRGSVERGRGSVLFRSDIEEVTHIEGNRASPRRASQESNHSIHSTSTVSSVSMVPAKEVSFEGYMRIT